MSISGKKVWVTGGAGALGMAICKAFLAEDAAVWALDRGEGRSAELEGNDRFHFYKIDLTSEAEVIKLFSGIDAPDVLVNAAGGFSMAPLSQTSLEDWSHMQKINLTTVFLTCREAVKAMNPSKGGRIINVSSFAAEGRTGGMAAYTVSKGGVIALTQALAEETLSSNITVNAVLPTVMDTPANRNAMPDADFSTWVPLENVAATMMFLARDSSWHITGACIPVRGHC